MKHTIAGNKKLTDIVLAKIEEMKAGREVILSDKECDFIGELEEDDDWRGRFSTLANPGRVGVLDIYIGRISKRTVNRFKKAIRKQLGGSGHPSSKP